MKFDDQARKAKQSAVPPRSSAVPPPDTPNPLTPPLVLERPVILSCLYSRDELARPEPAVTLPFIKLEEAETLGESYYLLKKQVRVLGVTMPVLEVLDTRNTFGWVKAFQRKILRHRWTEAQAREVFRAAVSAEIREQWVRDAPTIREGVRRIYQQVYTQPAVAALSQRIKQLRSAHFSELAQYHQELALLVDSYSVVRLMTPEEKAQLVRRRFWKGLSSNIRAILAMNRVSRRTLPDVVIRRLWRFKQKMLARYPLPAHFRGTVLIKAGTPTTITARPDPRPDMPPLAVPAAELAQRSAKFFPTIRPAPPAIIDLITPGSAPGTAAVSTYPALLALIAAPEHFVPGTRYCDPTPGQPLVVEAISHHQAIAGALLQAGALIALFYAQPPAALLGPTATERHLLALHNALRYFEPLVQGSPVELVSLAHRTVRVAPGLSAAPPTGTQPSPGRLD